MQIKRACIMHVSCMYHQTCNDTIPCIRTTPLSLSIKAISPKGMRSDHTYSNNNSVSAPIIMILLFFYRWNQFQATCITICIIVCVYIAILLYVIIVMIWGHVRLCK